MAFGIERLAALRRRGVKPSRGIVVNLVPPGTPPIQPCVLAEAEAEGIAMLQVREDESFDRLDLRVAIGLRVGVVSWSQNERALRALCAVFIAERAAGVVGVIRGEHGMRDARSVFAVNGWEWEG